MDRFEKVKIQLKAVEFIRLLKEKHTYKELESETGLSTADLNRYVTGKVLPSYERSKELIKTVGEDFLKDEIRKRITFDEGYVNHTDVIFSTKVLRLLPGIVAEKFDGKPDKVFTAASDGIPVASYTADFYDVNFVYAKRSKETGIKDFIEASTRLDSGATLLYYLPKGSISKGEEVLLVDDIVRTGHTYKVLSKIVEKADAKIFGIFSLFSFENIEKELEEQYDCRVDSLLSFE